MVIFLYNHTMYFWHPSLDCIFFQNCVMKNSVIKRFVCTDLALNSSICVIRSLWSYFVLQLSFGIPLVEKIQEKQTRVRGRYPKVSLCMIFSFFSHVIVYSCGQLYCIGNKGNELIICLSVIPFFSFIILPYRKILHNDFSGSLALSFELSVAISQMSYSCLALVTCDVSGVLQLGHLRGLQSIKLIIWSLRAEKCNFKMMSCCWFIGLKIIRYSFLEGFFKNPSDKIAMSAWGGGRWWGLGSECWSSSEVNLLVNLTEKLVHNAIRHFFLFVKCSRKIYTINPLCIYIWYNIISLYDNNLNGTNPYLKLRLLEIFKNIVF